jgi:hypothetical protein
MKQSMTTYDIADALFSDENANWSRAGAFALAEYLEEYEESAGEQIEFDRVAIRCDFSEYKDLTAFADEYFADIHQAADALGLEISMSGDEFEEEEEEVENAIREFIQDRGALIEFEGGIITLSF